MTNHATLSVHEQLNKCASDKGSQHTFTMEIIIDVKKNKYTFGIKTYKSENKLCVYKDVIK